MMTCAIVLANGRINDTDILCRRLQDTAYTLVIAADGGSHHADPLNLQIDIVIGDLDSLDGAHRARLEADGTHFEIAPSHKDETDLELALLYALDRGAGRVIMLGVLGGRLDMSLANMLLLTHPGLQSARVEIWNGSQTTWLIRPPGDRISGHPGDTLSLIPLGGDAQGVKTHHLEYPLRDETLLFGPARGVSNVFEGPTARVELREGLLLAVHTPGRA
jgi:thiamine pyrophosphokinase